MNETNYHNIMRLLDSNYVGDVASILGTIISVVGFIFTIYGVWASKSAAQRAEEAAKDTRKSIYMFEAIYDYSSAITSIDEIKRLHRVRAWGILPDRYAALRKVLINLRMANTGLAEEHKSIIKSVIIFLADLESQVEKAADKNYEGLDIARINTIMNKRVDKLYEILNELKPKGE